MNVCKLKNLDIDHKDVVTGKSMDTDQPGKNLRARRNMQEIHTLLQTNLNNKNLNNSQSTIRQNNTNTQIPKLRPRSPKSYCVHNSEGIFNRSNQILVVMFS